jgi:hypothetical protein
MGTFAVVASNNSAGGQIILWAKKKKEMLVIFKNKIIFLVGLNSLLYNRRM